MYTVEPSLPPLSPASETPHANHSSHVSVITENVNVPHDNLTSDNITSNDQPISSATAQQIIDAIERGDDIVPVDMGGLENMEL